MCGQGRNVLAVKPAGRKLVAGDLRNRGIVRTKLGRHNDAVADYDAALSLRPQDPDLLVRRAMVLNQMDRRDEAYDGPDRQSHLPWHSSRLP